MHKENNTISKKYLGNISFPKIAHCYFPPFWSKEMRAMHLGATSEDILV